MAQPAAEPGPPKRLGPKSLALLTYLREAGPSAVRDLQVRFPACRDSLRRLARRNLIVLEDRTRLRTLPVEAPLNVADSPLTLVPEQAQALAAIVQGIDAGGFAPFLLHGVTASGKTEVYLSAAAHALARGRQILVLLPEIALTHPVAQAFKRRFGPRVALLHSGLSQAFRVDQWRRIMVGEVDIVVGARSAVFAPLPRLGLVVVDEEHDPSYKQEGGFLYQARDVALYRGKLAGAAVFLVSATPQVTTCYYAREGKYRYLHLPRRVTPQDLPEIQLVDLRTQRGDKTSQDHFPPFAHGLGGRAPPRRTGPAVSQSPGLCPGPVLSGLRPGLRVPQLQRGPDPSPGPGPPGLPLLRLYRGGAVDVAPTVSPLPSSATGWAPNRWKRRLNGSCPGPGWPAWTGIPRPTVAGPSRFLQDFAAGELDILVGTQMITKGHHFPQVTLVGVIAADLSLFFPEYHAGERTFQLLSQVAGRAGRGTAKGRVLIQTYQPEHYVFQTVQAQDYDSFFQRELECRRQLGYPPFTRLALVRLSGPEEESVVREARRLADGPGAVSEPRSRLAGPGADLGTGPRGSYPPPGPLPLADPHQKLRPPSPAAPAPTPAPGLDPRPPRPSQPQPGYRPGHPVLESVAQASAVRQAWVILWGFPPAAGPCGCHLRPPPTPPGRALLSWPGRGRHPRPGSGRCRRDRYRGR